MNYSMRYYEVQQIVPAPPYVKSMYVSDLKEAVRLARFMSCSEKRECLVREVKDILYTSTRGDAEVVEMSRRVINALS